MSSVSQTTTAIFPNKTWKNEKNFLHTSHRWSSETLIVKKRGQKLSTIPQEILLYTNITQNKLRWLIIKQS